MNPTNPRDQTGQFQESNPADAAILKKLLGPPPLPPELRQWALEQQATEEEILAGLKEIQEQGGAELGLVIQALKQQRIDRERANT